MSEIKFTNGDIDKDFFTQNPHWRYLDSSIKLLKIFSPDIASKLRWAVFLISDPDSKYYRFDLKKRVELVNNYLDGLYNILFDDDKHEIANSDIDFLFRMYPAETMSKLKRDYFERELSYQILVRQERDIDGSDSKKLKDKADIQLKMSKIYDELKKAREEFEEENDAEKVRARGRQQPGVLFSNLSNEE